MAVSIPNRTAALHHDLLDHMELVRELQLDSTGVQASPEPPRRDIDLLILALYLRAQPPPSLQRAIEREILSPQLAQDSRVRISIETLVATEQLQQLLSNPDLDAITTRGEGVVAALEQCASNYPENFFAAAASLVAAQEKLRTATLRSQITQADVGVRVKELQARLVGALRQYLEANAAIRIPATIPGATGTEILVGTLESLELTSIGTWELQVVLLGVNNWVDLECMAVQGGCAVDALWPRILDVATKVRERAGKLRLPTCLLAAVDITTIEAEYLTSAELRASHPTIDNTKIRERLTAVVTPLLAEQRVLGSGVVDGSEAARLLDYLRRGSPYLRNAWSPLEFDRFVRECR